MKLPPPDGATPPQPRAARAGHLCVHPVGDAQRPEVEAFVQRVYHQRFDADVRHFAPVLVSLRGAQGQVVAAAGYRAADSGPLFLERYLPRSVEQLLPGAAPARARIVEVGHLAGSQAGEGRRLILLLGMHLAAQRFDWVVSTLTEELRHLFVRMGVAPLALGVADPDVLGDEAPHWGSYYEHRPVVLAGQIEPALQGLARRAAAA